MGGGGWHGSVVANQNSWNANVLIKLPFKWKAMVLEMNVEYVRELGDPLSLHDLEPWRGLRIGLRLLCAQSPSPYLGGGGSPLPLISRTICQCCLLYPFHPPLPLLLFVGHNTQDAWKWREFQAGTIMWSPQRWQPERKREVGVKWHLQFEVEIITFSGCFFL